MLWLFSVRVQMTIALSLCVAGTIATWWLLTSHEHVGWRWLAHWLLVVNGLAFAYYGLDKWLARRVFFRIPEAVLHTLAAIGGSPAALLAMWLFRHKTIKSSFRILFWAIVVLQIVLAAYVVKLLWWN
jgi:uncharacterized membrane protein YsdA (DUF1294 family)